LGVLVILGRSELDPRERGCFEDKGRKEIKLKVLARGGGILMEAGPNFCKTGGGGEGVAKRGTLQFGEG